MNFIDQLDREVKINHVPQKVVCLVPSISELVNDLGIGNRFAGVTRFCVNPASLKKDIQIVGGTKNINLNKIREINPDLVIANKEENDKEKVELLSQSYPVWVSNIPDLAAALHMINSLGAVLNCSEKAAAIHDEIRNSFDNYVPPEVKSCLYIIWKDPFMAAGGDTFINDMLSRAGLKNSLQDQSRYPSLSLEEITRINPEVILLSSEPFPFNAKHVRELQEQLPNSKVMLADGEFFSWYGSRLLKSVDYFKTLTF